MSDFSTNLQLPYLMPAQAQKHVTVNESLRRMDALVQMRVQSRTTTDQPASPDDGELWIAPPGKTGADWDLFGDNTIAFYRDGAWEQVVPRPGWFAFVVDEDELTVYGASGWRSVGIDGDQDVFVAVEADTGDTVAATTTVDAFTLSGASGLETAGDAGLKSVTISLTDTGVTAGAHGGADKTLGLTVDAQGRLTAVSAHDLGALAARDAVATGDLADGAVTLAKIQDVGSGLVMARHSAGTGAVETLTAAELRALLNVEDGAAADLTGAEIKTLYEAEADANAFTDAEKAKLGGVETGATADLTGAEIKTLYEGEADSNAFTDSEKAKLAAIDAAHYGAPLQSLSQLSALPEAGITDKERRYVEDELSDYFYDSAAAAGDVAPGDQTGGTGFWRKVAVDGETPVSIKTKYESNADTNAFTDAEKAKLAGVEAGATGDQTGGEIKTAYEAEADTNAFTDADKDKLGSVESGATADMTGAEIKTAYEAEADTNAFTDAEKTKLGAVEAGATGDMTGAEIKTAYEAEADTNAFTDAEKTKLAGIEEGATAGISSAQDIADAIDADADAEATLKSALGLEALAALLVGTPAAWTNLQKLAGEVADGRAGGMAVSFADDTVAVRAPDDPALNYVGAPSGLFLRDGDAKFVFREDGTGVTIAADAMGRGYRPGHGWGLPVEKARPNGGYYANNTDATDLFASSCTITAAQGVAPNGANALVEVAPAGTAAACGFGQCTIAADTASRTFSVFLASRSSGNTARIRTQIIGGASVSTTFRLDTGEVLSGAGVLTPVGAAGFLFEETVVNTSQTTMRAYLDPDITSGAAPAHCWAWQIDDGKQATTRMLNAGTAAPRAGDRIHIPTSALPWSDAGGLVWIRASVSLDSDTYKNLFQIDSGDDSPRIACYKAINTADIYTRVYSPTAVFNKNLGGVAGQEVQITMSWAANNFAASRGGGPAQTDLSGVLPSEPATHFRIGCGGDPGDDYNWDDWITALVWLPRPAVDAAEVETGWYAAP